MPPSVLSAFFVVSPELPPKETLLSNFLLTISSCSSVAARPDLAKLSPPNVVLVKPVMSPVLPSNLIGWFPVALPSVIFTTPSPANSTLPLPVVLVIEVISVKSPLTSTAYFWVLFSSPLLTAVVFLPSTTFTAVLAIFFTALSLTAML